MLLGVGVELVEEGARLDRDEAHHEAQVVRGVHVVSELLLETDERLGGERGLRRQVLLLEHQRDRAVPHERVDLGRRAARPRHGLAVGIGAVVAAHHRNVQKLKAAVKEVAKHRGGLGGAARLVLDDAAVDVDEGARRVRQVLVARVGRHARVALAEAEVKVGRVVERLPPGLLED